MAGAGAAAGAGAGGEAWYFTREQLAGSASRRCGLDADKELAYRQQAANLIQDMGQRLQVSQLCINTAIVYMHRFYAFHSFTHFHRNAIAAAALFLAAKVEEQPRKLEYVIKVAHVCLHRGESANSLDPRSEHYQEQAQDLVFNENVLLQTLGFDVAIDHPHTHVVRTCHLVKASKDLAQTSYFMASNSLHLTTMCLQFRPTVVACFCIHLASKWSNWAEALQALYVIAPKHASTATRAVFNLLEARGALGPDAPEGAKCHNAYKFLALNDAPITMTEDYVIKLIPQSNEGRPWFSYVDRSVTIDLLEKLTSEFLHIFDKCPSRLKRKMMSISSSGSPHSGIASHAGPSGQSTQPQVASSPMEAKKSHMADDFEKSFDREYEREKRRAVAPGGYVPASAPVAVQPQPQKLDFREYREKREREERERRQQAHQQQRPPSQSRPGTAPAPHPHQHRSQSHHKPHPYPHPHHKPPHHKPPHDKPPHDKLPHEKIPHEKIPHDKILHDKMPHDKIPHDKMPHDKMPHDKIPHDKIPHEKIPYEKISHEKIPHEKIPHEKIPHDNRHHRPPSNALPVQQQPTQVSSLPMQVHPEQPPQRTRPPSLFSPENATAPSAAAATAPRRHAAPSQQHHQQRKPHPPPQSAPPSNLPPVERHETPVQKPHKPTSRIDPNAAVREMQPPAVVSPLTSPTTPSPQSQRSRPRTSSSEPELVPVVKKLDDTPGYENVIRDSQRGTSIKARMERPHEQHRKASSPLRPVNGIETDPTLVSNLLKESLARPQPITVPTDRLVSRPHSRPQPVIQEPVKIPPPEPIAHVVEPAPITTVTAAPVDPNASSEHRHRSEKKKKKEKHKHKDRDKPRDERKKHKKDKEREKKRDEAPPVESHHPESVPSSAPGTLRITIPRDILATSPGLKIKIPKERLAVPPPQPPAQHQRPQMPQQSSHQQPHWQPPSHHASASSGIKIKIPREVVESSSRKRAAMGEAGPPQKNPRHNGAPPPHGMHKVEGGGGSLPLQNGNGHAAPRP